MEGSSARSARNVRLLRFEPYRRQKCVALLSCSSRNVLTSTALPSTQIWL
jgi:hypothetical protein